MDNDDTCIMQMCIFVSVSLLGARSRLLKTREDNVVNKTAGQVGKRMD
jgi:hypothetical protein